MTRRSREEIAKEYEDKAAKLRLQESRSMAVKNNKMVRKLLSTARAIKSLAESQNLFDANAALAVASDLEARADQIIGQARIDRHNDGNSEEEDLQ